MHQYPETKIYHFENLTPIFIWEYVYTLHEFPDKGFVFVLLPPDNLLGRRAGTGVVVHGPVEKQKRYKQGIRTKPVTISDKWYQEPRDHNNQMRIMNNISNHLIVLIIFFS